MACALASIQVESITNTKLGIQKLRETLDTKTVSSRTFIKKESVHKPKGQSYMRNKKKLLSPKGLNDAPDVLVVNRRYLHSFPQVLASVASMCTTSIECP